MNRNHYIRCLVALALAGALASCAGSDESPDDYPSKAIDYVIAFDPGGESDITARIQQEHLEEALGTNVNITYKPGAAGAVAWSDVARANPDGYTIAGFNLPHIVSQPMVSDDVGYETSDLKVVNIFQSTPNVLVVGADSPITTLDEYLEAAGEGTDAVSIGGTGQYTPNHIATLLLESQTGVELGYTEFTGTGETVPALLGGHVDSLFTFPTQLTTQPDEMRPLAVASEERLPDFPDVPTFTELGYDIVEGAYRGVLVPADTPDDIVDKLAEAFETVHATPEVEDEFADNSFVLENYGPDESDQFLNERETVLQDLFSELGVL